MKNLFLKYIVNERTVILLLLLLSGVLHGWNMFHFPYYENDEGAYMSQAWSLIKFGKLAPYTYWYDHAPAGWILIALWTVLSGGFFTFGASVNSGRVLMLILHLFSTYFLYKITKRWSKSMLAAVLAVVLFSISPLGIYFQRRVLLDNIMTFWILLSLWILTKPHLKLRHIIISSIAFGVAVLSKENAIFFLPAFIYALFIYSKKEYRLFAFSYWLIISFSLISLYFMYALINNELFPSHLLPNDTAEHVSLLQSISEQLARGNSKPFWQAGSEFLYNLHDWLEKDRIFILSGIIATIINIFLAVRIKAFRLPVFFALCIWLFLLRGKLVIVFYILPLLPFLAINTGMLLQGVISAISLRRKKIYAGLIVCATPLILAVFLYSNKSYLVKDETTPQLQTIAYIKGNLPSDAKIVIDDSMYVDLHDRKFSTEPIFPNAEWAWKVEKDPEVYQNTFGNDWKNIEYIALSHEILKQIKDFEFPHTKQALNHSIQIADYANQSSSYRNIADYVSTNGDWMSVYKVLDKDTILLENAWQGYKKQYIHSYGEVVDPQTNTASSSLQGEAMLLAAWMGDKESFTGLYNWTKDHFGYRGDHLFSKEWGVNKGKETLISSEADSYGDEMIAFSLISAYDKWHDPMYLTEAKLILSNIWKKEVTSSNGREVLIAGTDNSATDIKALQPAVFRAFSTVDPAHNWTKVADDSYYFIKQQIDEADTYSPGTDDLLTKGIIESILDAKMYQSNTAQSLQAFLQTVPSARESVASPLITASNERKTEFNKKILATYHEETGLFGPGNSPQSQYTAWIISALFSNKVPFSTK